MTDINEQGGTPGAGPTTGSPAQPSYFTGNAATTSFLPAIKSLLTGPRAFFANMPRAIYLRDAMFFVSIVIFLFSFLSVPFYSMALLFLLPATWGGALIFLLLWSKYLRWAVKTFTDSKLSAANAFQISAYAALPMALAAIPFLGFLAGLANLYLLWVGLSSYCRLRGGVAAVILLVPMVLLAITSVAFGKLLIQVLPQLAG